MPTGYTADVASGKITDFPSFALSCARAFGALIEMRDDPAGTPIPEQFKANTAYHDNAIAAAELTIADLNAMPRENLSQAATDALREAERVRAKQVADIEAEGRRYDLMEAAVTQWRPPTSEHTRLKEFMLEQIHISRNGRLLSSYREPIDATQYATDRWKARRIADAQRDIEYHRATRNDDIRRASERTAWVKALRASLPNPEPSP